MLQAITISAQDILQQVKLSCQIPSVVEQIVTRKVVIDAAAEAGIKVEAEELQQPADLIRLISKLKTADETWEWLKKNCLSLDDFEEMVYTNVSNALKERIKMIKQNRIQKKVCIYSCKLAL